MTGVIRGNRRLGRQFARFGKAEVYAGKGLGQKHFDVLFFAVSRQSQLANQQSAALPPLTSSR